MVLHLGTSFLMKTRVTVGQISWKLDWLSLLCIACIQAIRSRPGNNKTESSI